MWIIWEERNIVVFGGELVDSLLVVNKIKHISQGWFLEKVSGSSSFSVTDWWNSPLLCFQSFFAGAAFYGYSMALCTLLVCCIGAV